MPIDFELAVRQHETYCEFLEEHGFEIIQLSASDDHPDSVFIEDTAVVFDEIAVITNPGHTIIGLRFAIGLQALKFASCVRPVCQSSPQHYS